MLPFGLFNLSVAKQDLKVMHSTEIKVDWMFIKLAQFESNGAPRFLIGHLS